MSSEPITSAFNDGYVLEAYEAFRRDPASVDESWRQFFRFAERLGGAGPSPGAAAGADASPAMLRKAAAAGALAEGIRAYGHLAVRLDPLGGDPPGAPELTPEFYGLTEDDLRQLPAAAIGEDDAGTVLDVVTRLRARYAGTIALETAHVPTREEREWLRRALEGDEFVRPLTGDEAHRVLARLTEVDGLERFLGRAFQGKKRFSIEGIDALVPVLDEIIAATAAAGGREVLVGMAHRGRLNVLVNVMGKPAEALLAEFEGRHADTSAGSETGDVKYHMGYRGERRVGDATVKLLLAPNPSHLEFVGAVVNGIARANQRGADEGASVSVVVHGDAAFIGEGVVAEAFNMSRLAGYRVGGTIHLITNNQVGFTTDPVDARSTHYASDLAKGFDVPVLHVNADDAAACVAAARIAFAYRATFHKDVLIDLVGYRRHGHNEGEEPAYTQPVLYEKIRKHPTPRQVLARRLADDGVLGEPDAAAMEKAVFDRLEEALKSMRAAGPAAHGAGDTPAKGAAPTPPPLDTAVAAERLARLNEALLAYPDGFAPHPRLAKILERRRTALGGEAAIDWGHAETLAFAALVEDGVHVRLTGQDAERATFGQRNAVLHDVNTNATHTPLANIPGATGAFEVHNSPLAETAPMAFEYGFSGAADDALVLWEAQFGDFVNVAQPIIDQFIAADRAKWGQDSGLVLLLPHGYEGQGPEHSSARLERFLQLCAEGNMSVAYPTTPAQYFHLLRRQAMRRPRRPLVVMTPKSLLRMAEAASRAAELAGGAWQPVLDDAGAARAQVTRVVLCSGKVYYDLLKERAAAPHVALVRVEELYPFPAERLREVLDAYPALAEVAWVQEEPRNMGAWTYAQPRLRAVVGNALPLHYVGRPERASPAEGYEQSHKDEQARIVRDALAAPAPAARPKERKEKAKA